jgi:excisionase family DNA binding protein
MSDLADYPPVMNTKQVAEFLQVDVSTVTREAKKGKLPARKVGNLWRVDRDLLKEWFRTPEKTQ